MRRKTITELDDPELLKVLNERRNAPLSSYRPLDEVERDILGMSRPPRKKPGGKLRHAARARSSR